MFDGVLNASLRYARILATFREKNYFRITGRLEVIKLYCRTKIFVRVIVIFELIIYLWSTF